MLKKGKEEAFYNRVRALNRAFYKKDTMLVEKMEKIEEIFRNSGAFVGFSDKVCAKVIKDLAMSKDVDPFKDENLVVRAVAAAEEMKAKGKPTPQLPASESEPYSQVLGESGGIVFIEFTCTIKIVTVSLLGKVVDLHHLFSIQWLNVKTPSKIVV